MKIIIDSKTLELNENFKICWQNNPIAILEPGKNYLEPKLNLIIDDIMDPNLISKLKEFLNEWLKNFIVNELKDLVNLNKFKPKNSSVRALCYQLFENNGVLKRENVKEFITKLTKEDRKELRKKGIKIGRYHIYLYRIFKPRAVTIRILLWKNFFRSNLKFIPPKFGLNFINQEKNISQKFMLICGFEKLNNFYVRIDILERLFVKIIENDNKKNKIKLESSMMNLLGCTKENFVKLLESMHYKFDKKNKENEIYFSYKPQKNKNKSSYKKINKNDSPFKMLNNVSFNQR